MGFLDEFNALSIESLRALACQSRPDSILGLIQKPRLTLSDFAQLLSPEAGAQLEVLSRRSQQLTQQRFGKVMRLFAPLYVSNECINICRYCGFSRDNPILRVTLSIPEVEREADSLLEQGFRHVLLVAGEHPKFISPQYLTDCIRALHTKMPSISLEVGPMDVPEYREFVSAGAEGLVVYQETYDQNLYQQMHTAGPKKDFAWRLATPERAYAAGFRRLGIGALFGLSDWKQEAIRLAHHAEFLLRHCWRAQITISLPRLRPCAGEFQPLTSFTDKDLVQLVCALRLFLPDVGLVLSTREPARLRDGLIPLGITQMSAGSHTEPGGYTGAGKENVHRTEKGKRIDIEEKPMPLDVRSSTSATGQFDIADERSPAEVADRLRSLGYEPVWKDWDTLLFA